MSQDGKGKVHDEENGRLSPMISPNGDVDVEDTHPAPTNIHGNAVATNGKPPVFQRVQGKPTATAHRRTASESLSHAHRIPVHHSRVASTGDRSFLSALTDTQDYYGGSYNSRTKAPRMVGANGLEQPILSPKSVFSASSSMQRRLTLSDLKAANPLETEAEAAILNAIEMKQAENDVAFVLPDLPDEAVDMFQSARSPPPSPKLDSSISVNSPASTSAARRRWMTASKQLKSQRIVNASKTLNAANLMASTQSNLDVHEKLFAIAEQIQEVQADALDAEEDQSVQGANQAKKTNDGHDKPATQVDNLVQNANVLFRRSKPNELEPISEQDVDVESLDSSPNGGKRNRFFFGKGSKHPKKSDKRVADHLEIDTGVGEDDAPNSPSRKAPTTPMAAAAKKVAKKTIEAKNAAVEAKNAAVGDLFHFRDFLRPRQLTIYRYSRSVLQWMFLPTLILSFALYYAGNPTTCSDGCASFSWLFIFLFIRQVITFTLAKVLEVFIIDFLSLRNRLTVRIFGPTLTLLIVQSKGWPFTLLMWAVLDFAMLYGTGEFANHWLFYQDAIPVFNAKNPSGNALTNEWYFSALIAAVIVSCAYAVKRLWMGVHLGKSTYRQYGKQLASVMNDMLLISLLAGLGHDDSEEGGKNSRPEAIFKWDDMKSHSEEEDENSIKPSGSNQKPNADGAQSPGSNTPGSPPEVSDKQISSPTVSNKDAPSPTVSNKDAPSIAQPLYESSLRRSQKVRISRLLGEWDEPRREATDELRDMSLGAILQFRQALSYMDDDYPFSVFFGPAKTRELCVASSQQLYERLLHKTPGEIDLPFETIAQVATGKKGDINANRLKRLYRMFHPDADGRLGLIDFVRSIDKVYKDLRLLRAAIANSSQIDQTFERIFNFFFFVILAFIVLPIIGLDPLALILSLSGLIVGFAFMIGPASSKFFEGILFILVRRPYQIGDRIHISSPRNDTGTDGSPGWFVEKVDLYSTTVRFAATNELATYSNGSLAAERVINAARSPKAIVYINLKFGIDVEFAKIEVFRTTVETFVKARTREWLALLAFRATRVEADRGYVEYLLVLQHLLSWQDVGAILKNKAELASYCLEVSKQLEMRYRAPPLPVNLELSKSNADEMAEELLEPTPAEAQFGAVPQGAADD